MFNVRRSNTIAACLAAMALAAAPATAQRAPVRIHHENLNVASGSHDGSAGTHTIAYTHVIAQPGAPWMRLHISEADLGSGSFVVLRSMEDNGEQRLNAVSLAQWQYASAIFNGDRVLVELHVAPRDRGVFVRFDQVIYGERTPPDEGGLASLCGADNRVATTDNRVGRLYFGGCTAWRTTAGVFLTAGHCVDFDLDDVNGPQLPDGVLDLQGVVEFNVPASTSNGFTNAADPDDQYPIDTASVQWQFSGGNGVISAVGNDFAVFRVFPNANTGLTPEEAYGMPLRLSRETPAEDATIRITGFGVDTGAANQTEQTSTGPFDSQDVENANDITLFYAVDTTGAGSGSPVIWNAQGVAIGIHTNAGCNSDGSGANAGTSLENDGLETRIRNVAAAFWGVGGGSIRFVDAGHPLPVVPDGGPYRPFASLPLGATSVPNGGVVSIVAGAYTAAAGNTGTFGSGNKAMTLVAPAGTVTIGQ